MTQEASYDSPRAGCRTPQRARWLGTSALGLLLCFAVATGCASKSRPMLSPVTQAPTDFTTPGKFVWVDLITQDVPAAKSFYHDLFGWTFVDDEEYTPVLNDGTPIAGIVPAAEDEVGSEWVSNLSVTDVDAAAALIKKRGGTLEVEPLDAPNRGRIALVSDSEGALLLLVRSSSGDPAEGDPVMGGWLWQELWSHDVAGALDLYAELGGLQSDAVEFRDARYSVLKDGEMLRAGVVEAPPDINPLWLPYVRVVDAAATAARAESLGARIVMQDDRTAILVDPTGAPIGVGTWSKNDDADEETAQ